MIKKVIPIILSLCLMSSISAMAVSSNDGANTEAPAVSAEMPIQGGERTAGVQQAAPPEMPNGERPQGGNRGGQMPQGDFIPPQNNNTNNTETAVPQENNVPQKGNNQDTNSKPEGETGNNAQNPNEFSEQNGQQNRQFPDNMQNFNGQTQEEVPTGFSGFVKTYSTPITSLILLALAFVFVIFYRRKNY